jgi:hypothetical protein
MTAVTTIQFLLPGSEVIASHLKKHEKTAYLTKYEGLIDSIAQTFNNAITPSTACKMVIDLSLHENAGFKETIKFQTSYLLQEKLINTTTQHILTALRECALEIRTPVTNKHSLVCKL